MLFMQRRIENRKHTCISTFRDIYIYVLRIGDEQISLFHLCVILVHQFVPGFPPATLAQRRRRSAFYLPGYPLSTATRAAQAFLGELTLNSDSTGKRRVICRILIFRSFFIQY